MKKLIKFFFKFLKIENEGNIIKKTFNMLNWAIGIDMYTLMCIKLMPNKNLQYKKTNKQNN